MCDPRYWVLDVGSHSSIWGHVTKSAKGHCGHVTKSAKFGEGALPGDSDL